MQILDRSKNGPHHDEEATNIQRNHVPLPRKAAGRSTSWVLSDSSVKGDGDDHEDAEEDELHEQTSNDNFRSGVEGFECTRGLDATTCNKVSQSFSILMQNLLTSALQKERQDITCDKDLGHPLLANHDPSLAIDHLDDSSKLHVDCSGEKGWCDE